MTPTAQQASPAPSTPTYAKPARKRKKARRRVAKRLMPTRHFDDLAPLADSLKSRVLGQSESVERLIGSFSRLLSGLRDPSRPLLTAMLLGPTGVGKTETARAIAEALFGDDQALTRINCEEYAHSHQVAKLFGSPPGYVGQEVEPLLSQERIDSHHRDLRRVEVSTDSTASLIEYISAQNGNRPISVVLFDEIEKAHPVVWTSLLGLLDEGTLSLGDNRQTDFTHSIVLMTSNVGSKELGKLIDEQPMGFHTGPAQHDSGLLNDAVLGAARRHFPLEFLNRFDETLVYQALERHDLEAIFGKFLDQIHQRTLHQANLPLLLKVDPAAVDWILDQATDTALGARPLRRAMEREIVDPLSRLIAARQVEAGDVVRIRVDEEGLAFFRERRASKKIVA